MLFDPDQRTMISCKSIINFLRYELCYNHFLFVGITEIRKLNMTRLAHDMGLLEPEALKKNLIVLGNFNSTTNNLILSDSNLTIRNGVFTKTTGKFNILKGISRNADDSLTNEHRLEEIHYCFIHYYDKLLKACDDKELDKNRMIFHNAAQGFFNLACKYQGRKNWKIINNTVESILNSIALVYSSFFDKMSLKDRKEQFSQSSYNRINKVNLEGTCWALVADWCRRIILKNIFTYDHHKNITFNPNSINRRGLLMPKIFQLSQIETHADMGVAISNLPKNTSNDKLVGDYYLKQKSKRTLQEKFAHLKYTPDFRNFHLIHPINISDKYKDSQLLEIKSIVNFLKTIQVARDLNIKVAWKFGFTIKAQFENQGKSGGHACGLFFDKLKSEYYFMDPNYGTYSYKNDEEFVKFIYYLLKYYSISKTPMQITRINIGKYEIDSEANNDENPLPPPINPFLLTR